MMNNFKKLQPHVKVLLISAITYALSMNVDAIKNWVTPNLSQHPKLVSSIGSVLFVIALLQKPAVTEAIESILHINQKSPTEAVVTIEPITKESA